MDKCPYGVIDRENPSIRQDFRTLLIESRVYGLTDRGGNPSGGFVALVEGVRYGNTGPTPGHRPRRGRRGEGAGVAGMGSEGGEPTTRVEDERPVAFTGVVVMCPVRRWGVGAEALHQLGATAPPHIMSSDRVRHYCKRGWAGA